MINDPYSPPDGGRQAGGPTLDHLLGTLSRPARRRILVALHETTPREMHEFVPDDSTGDEFRVALYHNHLPHLADAGFVEWDREAETISRGPRYDELVPLVEWLLAYRDGLPAN